VRYANQLPEQIESLIVRLNGERPHWGARKIRELLVRRLDGISGFRPKAPSMRSSTAMAGAGTRREGIAARHRWQAGPIIFPRSRVLAA
jgi:hypothetical protein